jgi:hypothetical protein
MGGGWERGGGLSFVVVGVGMLRVFKRRSSSNRLLSPLVLFGDAHSEEGGPKNKTNITNIFRKNHDK